MDAVDFVAFHARATPTRLAAVELDESRSYSYAALDDAIARCAAVLADAGVGRSDRVVAVAKNHVLLVVLHHACARLSAVFAPLNVRLARAELDALVARTRPKLVVGDPRLGEVCADLTLPELSRRMEHVRPLSPGPIAPDAPSLLLYTSGTSGTPKGALLSERNLFDTVLNFGLFGRATRESVFLCDAPMFHVIGLVNNTRVALHLGGTFLVSSGFDPARTLARLMDPALRISHYFCVPQMLDALAAQPGFDARRIGARTTIFTGGAPHAASAIRRFAEAGLVVSHGYGMTEVGCVFHCPPELEQVQRHAGSVGMPSPRVSLRIVDDAGRPVPEGETGELHVRGEGVFCGYFEDAAATEAAFVDGWFATGDLFRRDAHGHYHVVDRKKNMFISGGENVYPAELEAHLEGFPGLRDAAVVGVPDPRWGEVGHLAFVPAQPGSVRAEALLAHLEARVGRFKLPRHVSELPELPRTASGKLQRHVLRARLMGQ